MNRPTYFLLLFMVIQLSCKQQVPPEIMQWHKLELDFKGPDISEDNEINPFTDYRMNVRFWNDNNVYIVPGFYAADGNASETSANSGNIWRIRFRPNELGLWKYEVTFRKGKKIAMTDDSGESIDFDGATGTFHVIPSDKKGRDFRSKGWLSYTGGRYLQFQGSGEYFLKGGTDSPENFLAYTDFDSTYSNHSQGKNNMHAYQPHLSDWKEGDPEWQNGKGKSIIGALNYLASTGVNSVYMLTMNIEGDGHDVWPYVNDETFTRFDCSKLDQWEIVFDYMDQLGIMQHFVTQETENEMLLDNGETGDLRKLYFRELVARFGHHPSVTWNMGEENGHIGKVNQDTRQEIDMINYMSTIDPYNNFIVLHTSSRHDERYKIMEPLLGLKTLDGPSIQIHNPADAHQETRAWLQKSNEAGKQWVVNIDEIGPASRGADEDSAHINNQDTIRWVTLWGNLMAGGGGVEWYCGYHSANNDLNAESWRTRDRLWKQTTIALNFFRNHLPFAEMRSSDKLINDEQAYCFSKSGEIYAIYDWRVNNLTLDLSDIEGTFTVQWFNPRLGGKLLDGVITSISAGSKISLGNPPTDLDKDWVILLKKQ